MPKKIYKKGRRKEYAIVHRLRKQNFDIVQRSAGSHSPVDIFAIHRGMKLIYFIQSKRILSALMSATDEKLKEKIEEKFKWLNGEFTVRFYVE